MKGSAAVLSSVGGLTGCHARAARPWRWEDRALRCEDSSTAAGACVACRRGGGGAGNRLRRRRCTTRVDGRRSQRYSGWVDSPLSVAEVLLLGWWVSDSVGGRRAR